MSAATFVDSHCHLDRLNLDAHGGDFSAMMAATEEAGVSHMLCIGVDLESFPDVQALADRYPHVFASVGVHPLYKESREPSAEELVERASPPKVVAIGETGLDYHYTAESAEIQKASLRVHCAAAAEAGLPLIIHARAADADMAAILSEEHANAPFDCVMHCFSSGAGLAKAALDLGFYLSMSGIAAFPKSQELRDIFAAAPLDRVLVETDSPYLAPPPYRGKRNEPGYTVHTAKVGAEVFGLSYEAFAAATQENFDRLFAKAARWQKAQAA